MSRIAIIAAMPAELKPLVVGWKQLSAPSGISAWEGKLNSTDCVAVCAGMGRAAAERAVQTATQSGPFTALVSVGWAGALSCGMQPGSAYAVNEVIDAATEDRFATRSTVDSNPSRLRLVTIDHVAHAAEKRQLGLKFQAVMVDMEAAAVARIARDRQLAFYCLKAVSDTSGEILPDFSRYTDQQGHLRLAALLAHVAVRPKYWPGLGRMARNGGRGAVEISLALGPLMGGV
jgi:adenosylhomocysteine nucleosidase